MHNSSPENYVVNSNVQIADILYKYHCKCAFKKLVKMAIRIQMDIEIVKDNRSTVAVMFHHL